MPNSNLTLGLEGVTVVFTIRGRTFTLTAPTKRITATAGGGVAGGGATPQDVAVSIHFKYDKPFEESFDLGTPAEVLAGIEELTANLPQVTGSVALADQWGAITQRLQKLPVLGEAVDLLRTTQVRLVRFEIAFSRLPLSTDRYAVVFTLGLVFVPDPNRMPSLLGARLTRFGAVVMVAGEGSAAELGIPV